MILAAAFLAPLSAPAPVLAANEPAQAKGADAPAPEDKPIVIEGERAKPRKICRSERATGSIMDRKVCRTVEQVAQDEAKALRLKEGLTADDEVQQQTALINTQTK